MRYTATATRDGGWWVVQCDQHPEALSQVKRLDQAANVHREAIAYVADVPEDQVQLEVSPALPQDVESLLASAREHREAADQLGQCASAELRKAVRSLVDSGYSLRDVGLIAGVSYQRAGQLASS